MKFRLLLFIFFSFSFLGFSAPVNDDCGGALTVTPGTSCINVGGTVAAATQSRAATTGYGTANDDVWFSFVAGASTQFINATGTSATGFNPVIEIFSGSCASLTSIIASNSVSTNTENLTVNNLVIGQTYYYRVYDFGSGTATNPGFNTCVTNGVSNDDCIGALTVTPGSTCTSVAGDGTLATQSLAATCSGTANDDVWFKFTASASNQFIKVTPSASYNPVIQVYSGACGGTLISVKCHNPSSGVGIATSTLASGLNTGQTYYYRVFDYSGTNPAVMTFTTCVVNPVSNDECSGATSVTAGSTCTSVNGDLSNASLSQAVSGGFGTSDVWYKFVANTTTEFISITSSSGMDPVLEIFSGTCAGTLISIKSDASTFSAGSTNKISVTGLTVGQTYYYRISDYSASPSTYTFSTCVTDGVVNDDCIGAYVVTPGATCTSVNGDGTLATQSLSASCGSSANDDVWFKFTAAATSEFINVTASTNYTAVIQVYSGTCASLTSLVCDSPFDLGLTTSTIAAGLTVGNTYYYRVYDYYSINPSTMTFTTCLVNPVANDECTGAYSVTPGATCTSVSGDGTLATQSAVACAGASANDDVWYKFVAAAPSQYINVNPSANYNPIVQVYSGSCASLTSVNCDNQSLVPAGALMTSTVTGLTVGQTYYYRVYDYSSINPTTMTFTTCVTNPEVNDECSGAILLDVKSACNFITIDNTKTTQSATNPSCGTPYFDMWYKAIVPANGKLSVMMDDVSFLTYGVSLYSGVCGTLVEKKCKTYNTSSSLQPNIDLTGLTPGQTIYLRFFSTSSTSYGPLKICVSSPPDCLSNVPASDACGTATSICNLHGYCGTTNGATIDEPGNLASALPGGMSIENNVWLTFTAQESAANFSFYVSNCQSTSKTGLQILIMSATNCNGYVNMTTPFNPRTMMSTSMQATGLTIGQPYLIMIDGSSGDKCDFVIAASSGISLVNAGKDTTICSGTVLNLAATGPGNGSTYTWKARNSSGLSNVGSGANINVTPTQTTTYIVEVTGGSLCTGIKDSMIVTVNTTSVNASPSSCNPSNNQYSVTGTHTFTNPPSTGTLIISSSCGGNSYTQNAPFTSPINYSISGLTSNGANCTVTATFTSNINCNSTATYTAPSNCSVVCPTASISYNGPFCKTLTTAQNVTLTGTGTNTGGTYSSTTGLTINSTTGAITPSTSSAGTYTITYTIAASGGCSVITATTTVVITALPTASISYSGPYCKSLTTPQAVTLTGTNNTGGNYTSTTGLSINSSSGEITPSTSTAGTYTVSYTIPASGGCAAVPASSSVVITTLPTATIAYSGPYCSSIVTPQAVTLTGSNNTGGTYSSTTGLTINSTTGAVTPNSTTPSTYTVTYTIPASGGCAAVSATTSVVINPILTPVISCGTSTSSSVLFTWSAVTGATGYSVSYQINSNAVVNVGAIGNVLTYSRTGLNAMDNVILTLTPTGGTSPCFGSSTQTCQASNCVPPTANISYSGTPFCKSLTTGEAVTISGTNGTNDASLAWNFSGGTYSSTTGLSINSSTGAITPSTSTSGSYSVTYTIPTSGSCSHVTATTSVLVTAPPTASISYSGPYCSSNSTSQSVVISGTNAYTGGSYSSTTGLTISSTTGAITPSSSTPGSYSVTYTTPSSGGCSAITSNTNVVITALPTATLSYTNTPFCKTITTAESPVLTGTNVYTSGNYSSTTGLTIDLTTGAIIPSSSTAGSYTVTYTIAAAGGCSAVTATTPVVVTAPPTASISYAGPYCSSNSTAQSVVISGTNAYTGGSYSSTTGLTISSTTGAITPSSSTPGSYSVTYTTPSSGGCSASTANANVEITALPTATLSYTNTPFCKTITTAESPVLTGTNAYTSGNYSSTTGLTINSTTGAISPSSSTPGTYTVTYTIAAAGGCSAVTATTPVVVTAPPTASISYAGPYCSSNSTAQSVVISGTNAYTGGSYSSTTGLTISSTTGAITPSSSTPGSYSVTYTTPSSGGCSASTANANVVITALPTATLSYTNTPFCKTITTAESPVLTGTNAYTSGSYSSTTGLTINSTTGAITPSSSTSGTYTVTYTIAAAGGCSAVTATTPVVVTAPPTASISYAGPYCSSNSTAQSVVISGTNAYTGGSYSSTTGLTISSTTGAITPSSSTPGSYSVTYTTPSSGGCSASTANANVEITALPTATLSYTNTPFCKTITTAESPVLTGTNAYTSGNYSSTTGLTINSTTGAISPSSSTPGTYTVTYTIAAAGGCSAVTATTPVVVTAPPTASISYAGPYCSSNSTAQSVVISGTNAYTGGSYSSTTGLTISSTTGAITPSSSTPGSYSVTYTTPSSGGCSASTANANVVITALPTATLSYTNTPFCKTITTAENPVLTGTNAYTSGSYSSTIGLTIDLTTGAIIPSSSTSGTYTVTYTIAAAGGCSAVTATTPVVVTAPPTASVSYSGPYCSSNTTAQSVVISGANAYTGGSYSSTTGLTISSSTGAITPSSSTPGSYSVTYTTPSSGGCSASTANANVVITALPTATLSYTNTPFCKTITTAESPVLTGTNAYTSGSYSSTTGLTIDLTTGAIIPSSSTPGTYTVRYTIAAAGGCSVVTATTPVSVVSVPTASISANTICENENGILSFAGTPNSIVKYTTDANSTNQTITLNNLGKASLTLNALTNNVTCQLIEVQLATTPSCPQNLNSSAEIIVNRITIPTFNVSVNSGCVPLKVEFSNTTSNSLECKWLFGDGTSLTGCGIVPHTYTKSGCFDVTLTSKGTNGCIGKSQIMDMVCVDALPIAKFYANPSEMTVMSPETTMKNVSINAISYIWDFGDGQNSTDENPKHLFNVNNGLGFTVQLIAISANGCRDTTIENFTIKEEPIYYVPNTFTPDDDKFNQHFLPVFSMGIEEQGYNLLIFNRWGEIIFESNDLKVGWDGTYGGKIVQEGVYTWKIGFSLKGSDDKKMIIGHLNLLK